MVRTILFLLALVPLVANAQTRCVLRQIDFQDPANSEICKPHTDNLAVILVDAYLSGKLNAYSAGPLDSLIHGLELQKRRLSETETNSKRRTERKKVGKKIFSKTKSNVTVSVADLQPLSKSEFLKQMVILEDEVVQWDKATRYERGKGLVYHKGLGYFAKKDTVGIPPPNKAYWELAYNASIPFYFRIPDLPAISIFGQYVTVDRKEVWQPLLIRVTRTGEVPDYLVDMSVSFKYEEAMKYLTGIGQPLLYKDKSGYVGGGTFVLNNDERTFLQDRMRSEVVSNTTFKSNVAVSSMIAFTSFLDKSDKESSYTLFQDPSGKELRMFRQNIPVAVIPTGAVEQMLSFPKTNVMTWSQAFSQDIFRTTEIPLRSVSSELPYKEVLPPESNPNPRPSFFLEKYTINTVGAVEQKRLRSRFTNLIKLVTAQFKAGILLLAEEKDSWFRARFDWSTLPEVKAIGGAVNKAYWPNLLHHDDISDVRYPYYWSENSNVSYLHKKLSPLRVDSLEFGVTYKRAVAPEKGKAAYEPFQVSLRSMQRPGLEGNDFPTYTFNWPDLRKAIVKGKDPLLVELVKLIETAALPYTDSSIVYGVIEEAPVKQVAAKK